jgi:beta-glucosidase
MAQYQFPDGFLWGTATAAHQVEGDNTESDIWLMEQVPGTMFVEPSGNACEHYQRYPEDIALLAGLGFNSYRFSVEWARIEPSEGEFSDTVLQHYSAMVDCCLSHGLKPFVTLHHFTSPRWLMRRGGWEGVDTPTLFARYAEKVISAIGDRVSGVCTINEANIGRVLTSSGMLPSLDILQQTPGWQAAAEALGVASDEFMPFMFAISETGRQTIMAAHHQAVNRIKTIQPHLPCGVTLAVQDIVAGPGGEVIAAKHRHEVNELYLNEVTGDDFIGVQCYSRHRYDANGAMGPEPGVDVTDMGYEFWPEALEQAIRQAHAIAGIPALQGVQSCLADGIPVLGYTYWSAMDNFEWMLGYRPQFGIISVDRSTQQRSVKESGRWLGGIARTNTLDPDGRHPREAY